MIAGVVDTGDKFIACDKNKDAMEVGSCQGEEKVEGDKSAISSAADDVIRTAMKSCIHRHPTHLDQRPLRPPKLNNAVLVCRSFGGLMGLRACEEPFPLFVVVPMTISAAVADFGGRGRLRRLSPTSAAGVSFAESSSLCRNRRCR